MKNRLSVSAIIFLLILVSCGPTYNLVSSDYDRSADFTKYKTFAWLPDKADTVNTPYNNEIIRNNIRNYFGQCISDRGYSFDQDNPELLLQLDITNAKKERVITSYPSSYYYRPYFYGSSYYSPYRNNYYYRGHQSYNYQAFNYPLSGYSSGSTTTQKQEYVQGAITLNFIDAKLKKMVWTGTAKGDIYDASYISKDLHPAVHSIIDAYPVKPLTGKNHRTK